ncbi:MAG: ABC transporter permease [Chloroflexi bacterium]|nr:ABC transporter permease [Chloroflexota bacterium]PWB45516.1 MAG: ABC transporter permease [Dehalococcoidia bacterium]
MTTPKTATLEVTLTNNHSRVRRWMRALRDFIRYKPVGAFGLAVILALLVTAAIPGVIAPSHYSDFDLLNRFQDPSSSHIFGTDNQGRDVFSRVVYGARTSVTIGLGVVLLAAVFSTTIGLVSGYYGKLPDLIIQRLIDIWQAFPGLIFIIFLLSIFSPSQLTLIVALGVLFTAGSSRVIRSSVLQVKQGLFVEAARSTGASDTRILLRHILPNIAPILIINASVQIGAVILVETSLSFLGFGIPPPFPSWGGMLQAAQPDMQQHPYLALFPGLAIVLTVYSFNMLGDALRDVLDPRMRGMR